MLSWRPEKNPLIIRRFDGPGSIPSDSEWQAWRPAGQRPARARLGPWALGLTNLNLKLALGRRPLSQLSQVHWQFCLTRE